MINETDTLHAILTLIIASWVISEIFFGFVYVTFGVGLFVIGKCIVMIMDSYWIHVIPSWIWMSSFILIIYGLVMWIQLILT